MTDSKRIELPKEVTKAERVNPENMIIFGLPKVGKTTELVKLPNHLLIDYENGSKFVDGVKVSPPEGGPVSRFKWLKELAAQIREAGRPYDFVIIDTFSQIDEDSEWNGTWKYMNSVQGKKFNRENGEGTPMLKPSDINYNSVHTLPEGFGYRWSRNETTDMYELLAGLGKICTIFVVHVADKFLAQKTTNTEVVTRTLSLTGKLKDIIARKVDAIGYLYNEEGTAMVSFKGNEEKIGGVRAKHIIGYEGPLDWNKIFI